MNWVMYFLERGLVGIIVMQALSCTARIIEIEKYSVVSKSAWEGVWFISIF